MNQIWRFFDRREFLRRSAFLIPAFHAGFAGTVAGAEPGPTTRPAVEFLELELRSHRIDEQRIFYRDALGLDTTLEGSALVVQAGATRLRFVPAEAGSEPMYHFAIPENKLDRAIEWMKGRAPLRSPMWCEIRPCAPPSLANWMASAPPLPRR